MSQNAMSQNAMIHDAGPTGAEVTETEMDQAATAGWAWFTRFLLINVILCVLGLLFVGALTVWA